MYMYIYIHYTHIHYMYICILHIYIYLMYIHIYRGGTAPLGYWSPSSRSSSTPESSSPQAL